jgi:hypothetical protein
MKRIVFVFLMLVFLLGCGTLGKKSEFWQHDSVYKNWDHLKFSWYGYKNVSEEEARMSKEQGWWGIGYEK